MPRPRNASYRSHRLIHEALSSGPKYGEELLGITGLNRTTLWKRLKFLVSEGLIRKNTEGEGRYVYYENIEPLTDEQGNLRVEGLRWLKHLVKPEEERQRKRQFKAMIKEKIINRETLARFFRIIEDFHVGLDELISLRESQEVLNLIENWQNAPVHRIWLILSLNKLLVDLNSQKLICPECHHYTIERNEVVCERCGFVVGDEIIPPRERLEMILAFLENTQID